MTLRFRPLHPLPGRHILRRLIVLILQELLDIRREVSSHIFLALVFGNPYIAAWSAPVCNECGLVVGKFANIAETELSLLGASDTADIRESRRAHF